MCILYSGKTFLEAIQKDYSFKDILEKINKLIRFIQNKMYDKINVNLNENGAVKTLRLYKEFYQRIVNRNKDLSRINVTTHPSLINFTS